MKKSSLHIGFLFGFFLLLISCGKDDGVSISSRDCFLPTGTTLSENQRYIQGPVQVPIGGGRTTTINLHVQRLEKLNSSTWGTTPIKTFASTGKTPCESFDIIAQLWRDMYQNMIDAGLDSNVINFYASGISNQNNNPARSSSGVYAETNLGACGYAGAAGTIHCDVTYGYGMKEYFMAHENTHAFQWDSTVTDNNNQNILLFRTFAAYANLLYHQSITDNSVFTDSQNRWIIDLNDYALQNEAEWIAMIFPNYLYGGTGHWAYIFHNQNNYAAFFDCIWKEGKTFVQCQTNSNVPVVSFAQKVPVIDIPVYSGLSNAESEAIWNICFDMQNKAIHTTMFNRVINSLTSNLYPNADVFYKLGYGDCNHDGYLDWVCTYQGSAPNGGNYLWNSSNQIGAYTFIASGKAGDDYAEYKQDPYDTSLGTLLRPEYREWKGSFGSCNGSGSFSNVPTRFPTFTSGVSNLPIELNGKVNL